MFISALVALLFHFYSTATASSFLNHAQNVYGYEGRNVSLEFHLINKPSGSFERFTLSNSKNDYIARVYYYGGGLHNPIVRSGRFRYTGNLTAKLFSFTLIETKTSDAGVYTATDISGDTSNITLYIFQPLPKPVITLGIAVAGKDVNLNCKTVSQTLPAPGLPISYSWKRNGTTVKNNAKYTLHGTKNNQLTINKIGRNGKFDQYSCEAKEENGQTQNSGIVFIDPKYGPDKTTMLSTATMNIYEYQNTTPITCSADCNPKCLYTWWRESDSIHDGASFQLLNIQRSQEGHYKCVAENYAIGQRMTGYAQLMIYVRNGPNNSTMLSTNTTSVLENQNTPIVTCSADCNPQCTFSWWRGSARIHTGPVFQLFNVQRNQEGIYRCKAGNSVGNQTMMGSADLMVYVKSYAVIYSAIGTSVGTFLLMLLFMVLIIISLRRNGYCKRDGKQITHRQEYRPDNVSLDENPSLCCHKDGIKTA